MSIDLIQCRSQFEKSENKEDNIKTVVDLTTKRDASNADKYACKEDATKVNETMMPKSNLKNPTTPKTPRDKVQPNSEIKSKDGEKEKIKDDCILFHAIVCHDR